MAMTDKQRALMLGMTPAQVQTIEILGGNPSNFVPVFDLPPGYVAGWAKDVYYGIDPEGQASS